MAALRQDLAYAFRSLRKQPGFTATAVLMLSIGIGANVAIFSLVHAVLVRPLPFAHPDRLVLVHLRGPDLESPGTYRQHGVVLSRSTKLLREHQQTFESLGVYTGWIWNVTGSGSPERLVGEMVDADVSRRRSAFGQRWAVRSPRMKQRAPARRPSRF